MKEITLKQAIRATWAEVKAKGEDYRYTPPADDTRCVYVSEGEPSCGVGHVLINHFGVRADRMEEGDKDGGLDAGQLLSQLHYEGVAYTTTPVRQFFTTFQASQDLGSTWGHAFGVAVGVVSEYL